MQCVNNFNRLGDVVGDYMVFKFDEDDYTTALYNYRRFVIAIDINLELLQKVNEINKRYSESKNSGTTKTITTQPKSNTSKKDSKSTKSKAKTKKSSKKDSDDDTETSDANK